MGPEIVVAPLTDCAPAELQTIDSATHTHIHTNLYTYTHTHTHTHSNIHASTYTETHIGCIEYIFIGTHTRTHIYIYMAEQVGFERQPFPNQNLIDIKHGV